MPSQATKYKILIASPSDVVEERKAIPEVIEYWNSVNSDHYGVILKPVLWEIDATPEMGKSPQAIINKQLVKNCDILVGTFWTRLGTPTGKAESGTVEEIEEFLKDGKPVLLYFSSIPVAPESINVEQYKRLLEFKKRCEKEGLVIFYKSIDELQKKFQMHITKTINEIHKEPSEVSEELEEVLDEGFEMYKNSLNQTVGAKIQVGSVGSGGARQNTTVDKTINPRVYDEKQQPPIGSVQLPSYTWDFQNFEEFYYDLNDDLGAEQLTVISVDGRTIKQDNLIYTTRGQGKTLNVVKYAFNNNYSAAANAGLEKFDAGDMAVSAGQYNIVGWQAQPYVGIKNHSYKLAKLIIEQGNATSEKKTLTVGETWDIGGGWQLTANAIDAKAIPRQVWLTLSKDGIKKDDKVVAQGNVYTYVERRVGGESDVPLFVTYIDRVFAGATSDMVQLRYTWALDASITEIKGGDRYGVFTVESVEPIQLNTDVPVILSKGSTVDIMGNLKFKIADDPNFLRFCPLVLRNQ